MNNQIFRIETTNKTSIEISIIGSNEVAPYVKTKEIDIRVIGDGLEIIGGLNLEELNSLIKYLTQCEDYIDNYNREQRELQEKKS